VVLDDGGTELVDGVEGAALFVKNLAAPWVTEPAAFSADELGA
jgi:hypothetical protein